jgi:2-polyprenyl-3-methyl-5-hydroxy-6-metoxy-1,4-benzoquinol methylase
MNRIHNCLLCNKSNMRMLVNYQKDHLVKCRDCSFVFSNQKSSPEELNAVCSKYFRGQSHPSLIIKEKFKKRARQLNRLKLLKSVLDVGYGDGHILQSFHVLGVKTYGTEFDEHSAMNAQKKEVIISEGGLLPKLPKGMKNVDAIIFAEVIEHINKILSPGGE